jgi:hypothetical protein
LAFTNMNSLCWPVSSTIKGQKLRESNAFGVRVESKRVVVMEHTLWLM